MLGNIPGCEFTSNPLFVVLALGNLSANSSGSARAERHARLRAEARARLDLGIMKRVAVKSQP